MEKQKDPRGLYQKMDDKLMDYATKGVKAWNWTTGLTKASLANTMLYTGGSAFFIALSHAAYECYDQNHFAIGAFLAVTSPFYLVSAHVMAKRNNKYEKMEADAASKGAVSYKVMTQKKEYENSGNWFLTGTAIEVFLGNGQGQGIASLQGFNIGATMAIFAGSQYVMRTDYMPPRKNAFARGWDKLKEFARDMKQPVAEPVPVSCVRNELRG